MAAPTLRRRLVLVAIASTVVSGCGAASESSAQEAAPATSRPAVSAAATSTRDLASASRASLTAAAQKATATPTVQTPPTMGIQAPPTMATQARPKPGRKPTSVPPISAKARAAGLIDVRTVVPDAIIDLRYRTKSNFTRVVLYPTTARCLVHRSMRSGLATAASRLRRAGYLLVFWDCYRPHSVQKKMFAVYPDPTFVARPGPYARSHEAARSVDVTIARRTPSRACPVVRRVQRHCLVSMNTGFDSFSPKAAAFATKGVSATARANRARLRLAMKAGGIGVYVGEWWHFDGPGAAVARPHLNAPLS